MSSKLIANAQAALRYRYGLTAGQRVHVIYDASKQSIGKTFVQAARQLGAKADIFHLRSRRFSAKSWERIIGNIESGDYDLFINVIEARIEETKDRMRLMEIQKSAGAKVVHCPNIEESMLMIEVDYQKMIIDAKKLMGALRSSVGVNITTSLGTDLEIAVAGRKFHNDVIPKENDWGNFPCGEVFCAPIEDSANGTLIADGSAGGFGILPQPLRFEIENGRINRLSWLDRPSANASLLKKIKKTLTQDDHAGMIGELGIGLAPYPISGNPLQDEKVAGTIHIAFGNNVFFGKEFGGKNKSKSHVDFIVESPELIISYPNQKSSRSIIKDGYLLI